jgi:hypothetical protein
MFTLSFMTNLNAYLMFDGKEEEERAEDRARGAHGLSFVHTARRYAAHPIIPTCLRDKFYCQPSRRPDATRVYQPPHSAALAKLERLPRRAL